MPDARHVSPARRDPPPPAPGEPGSPVRALPLGLALGAVYAYYRGGRYRPLGVAVHAHSGQELVVYEGLAGGLYAAPLWDWYAKFKRVPDPAPESPPRDPATLTGPEIPKGGIVHDMGEFDPTRWH